MADRSHRLVVVGLKGKPAEFRKTLARVIYGNVGPHPLVELLQDRHLEFRFNTEWDVKEKLTALSAKHKNETFLLERRCWERGVWGQMIIRDGKVLEEVCRQGYGGPDYLWSEITNPLVDLFKAHLEPRTLAQAASSRLDDAITVVRQLKETLQDERFTTSRYRADGDSQRVKDALVRLILLVDSMKTQVAQISFEGVLLEEREVAHAICRRSRHSSF